MTVTRSTAVRRDAYVKPPSRPSGDVSLPVRVETPAVPIAQTREKLPSPTARRRSLALAVPAYAVREGVGIPARRTARFLGCRTGVHHARRLRVAGLGAAPGDRAYPVELTRTSVASFAEPACVTVARMIATTPLIGST